MFSVCNEDVIIDIFMMTFRFLSLIQFLQSLTDLIARFFIVYVNDLLRCNNNTIVLYADNVNETTNGNKNFKEELKTVLRQCRNE